MAEKLYGDRECADLSDKHSRLEMTLEEELQPVEERLQRPLPVGLAIERALLQHLLARVHGPRNLHHGPAQREQ